MEMIYSKELGLTVLPETRKVASDSFGLTDAPALYYRLKRTGETSLFFESSKRSIRYLIECLGHNSLTSLEVSDAGRFRDYLFEHGMSSSSMKRVFSSARAVINLAIREHCLMVTNVFSGTFIPDEEVKKKRLPIPAPDLLKVQQECIDLDDEPRWLIALIIDTGIRLSEACGLQACDIPLNGNTPYINLVEHPWRRLKSSSRSRQVTLVGASLWAAHRILETGSTLAFPKYCSEAKCNANSASAALNKWLKPRVPDGCVIHSCRHSLRDRLRAIEFSADIIDAIGGWTTERIGHQYGKGHSLAVMHEWIKRLRNGDAES